MYQVSMGALIYVRFQKIARRFGGGPFLSLASKKGEDSTFQDEKKSQKRGGGVDQWLGSNPTISHWGGGKTIFVTGEVDQEEEKKGV